MADKELSKREVIVKKLSIEEKTKAYNEIMSRAKKELDTCGSQDCDA